MSQSFSLDVGLGNEPQLLARILSLAGDSVVPYST